MTPLGLLSSALFLGFTRNVCELQYFKNYWISALLVIKFLFSSWYSETLFFFPDLKSKIPTCRKMTSIQFNTGRSYKPGQQFTSIDKWLVCNFFCRITNEGLIEMSSRNMVEDLTSLTALQIQCQFPPVLEHTLTHQFS